MSMRTGAQHQLDNYLPEEIRQQIESIWYAKVNDRARLEELCNDPYFMADPESHVATYSDHGVVHARDVALQILHVLDAIHGVLIPEREPERLRFMKGYGVILAYLHDIGMVDFSSFGRTMHAEYATHAVLSLACEDIVAKIWAQNSGNMAWRIAKLADSGALMQDPTVVLREMLSMAICHSKSVVPIKLLRQRDDLRALMLETATTSLQYQYVKKRERKAKLAYAKAIASQQPRNIIDRLEQAWQQELKAKEEITSAGLHENRALSPHYCLNYKDIHLEAFRWLTAEPARTQELVSDVIDTIRALRCADALRQRGTAQKTSGGYEVFVNQATANAIYAMRYGSEKLYFLEISNAISAGEANLASSELGRDGELRVSFHVGAFSEKEALARAVNFAALIVEDIQADVIESFDPVPTRQKIEILLEEVDDNLEFSELVRKELIRLNPDVGNYTRTVPALKNVANGERELYLHAQPLTWDLAHRQLLLERIKNSGHIIDRIDTVDGFKDVRLVELESGTTLIEAGEPSGFVYIPLTAGCRGFPLGGYEAFEVHPWIPLGVSGVVRGAARNATIVAYEPVQLLMIPKGVFLKHWHHTYDLTEFMETIKQNHT